MITVIAHHTAAAGAADAAGNRSPGTRLPPGCLQFDAHEGIDTPDEFAPSPHDAERSDNR